VPARPKTWIDDRTARSSTACQPHPVVWRCYADAVTLVGWWHGRFNVEHNKEYQSGRYRVVEQIERVKEGFRVSVTAFDDQTVEELNGHRKSVSRFDARWVAATLEAARRDLAIAVNLMNRSIASDTP
jgi:hypothetical protein